MTRFFKSKPIRSLIILMGVLAVPACAAGQQPRHLQGTVLDKETGDPVPYATITLHALPDSVVIGQFYSRDDGSFRLHESYMPPVLLVINAVGYGPWMQAMESSDTSSDGMTIYLHPISVALDEAQVFRKRPPAISGVDRTTYSISKGMKDASHRATDILRLIPGLHVDLMHNIRLDGSANVLILVDGKERDRNFLLQLKAEQIDKIEIVHSPSAAFEGSVTGIIHILLNAEESRGFSGNAVVDIPARKKEMYLFPVANLHFGLKQVNLHASYNGEFAYFDLDESTILRQTPVNKPARLLSTRQSLRQENWEHRFTYGIDYFMDNKNVLNFYANHRIYANEASGVIHQYDNEDLSWTSDKIEADRNHSGYYSLYYQRREQAGEELSVDAHYYHYDRVNVTRYRDHHGVVGPHFANHSAPAQYSLGLKVDYARPISEPLSTTTGFRFGLTGMRDQRLSDFDYDKRVAAAYATLTYAPSSINTHVGLRLERSFAGIVSHFDYDRLDWLPHAGVSFQINPTQTLTLNYSRKITRPLIYQLNPTTYRDDPFILRSGNTRLVPELINHASLTHAVQWGNNYLSAQAFYQAAANTIGQLLLLNEA